MYGRRRFRGRSVSAFRPVDIVLSATVHRAVVKAAGEARSRAGAATRSRAGSGGARDIDTAIDGIYDVYRYDVDARALRGNTEERSAEVHAEAVVKDSVRRFHDWYSGLQTVDVVRGLREDGNAAQASSRSTRAPSRLSTEDRQLSSGSQRG
jgi:glutamyl-tRNA reductase